MNRLEPAHIDTAALFVRNRWRGTLLRGGDMGLWERMGTWHRVPVRVHNARLLDPPATLDSHGFELLRADGAVGDRQSVDRQCEAYRIDSRRIVEALTGCEETRILNQYHRGGFDGLRPGDPLEQGVSGTADVPAAITPHVREVHTDGSPLAELRSEWNAFVKGRHGAVFSVWRSTDLDGPVEDMPLAVCRADSVAQRDMVATWFPDMYPGGGFVYYHLAHDASQQWFYYPRMTSDEVLVIRLYDTREPLGGRRGVFHAAVADPGAPSEARRRESVDIRVAAAFGDETERDARRARFLAELPPVPGVPRHPVGAEDAGSSS